MITDFQRASRHPGSAALFVVLSMLLFSGCTEREHSSTESESELKVEEGYFPGADGVQLFYRKVGSGDQTAVYLHGGPGSMSDGGYELDRLAQDRVLIAFDQRSGGRSELVNDTDLLTVDHYVRDLESLREHFGLAKMTLIGQSWGSILAAIYTSEHPDRVERLLLLSPGPPAYDPYWDDRVEKTNSVIGPEGVARITEINEAMPTVDDEEVVALCREQFALIFRAYLNDISALDRMKVGYCDYSPESIRHQAIAGSYSRVSLGNWDLRPKLRALQHQALVVEGEDTHVPLDATREWVASLPNGRLLLMPNANHMTWLEGDLDYFFTTMNGFLDGAWPEGAEVIE